MHVPRRAYASINDVAGVVQLSFLEHRTWGAWQHVQLLYTRRLLQLYPTFKLDASSGPKTAEPVLYKQSAVVKNLCRQMLPIPWGNPGGTSLARFQKGLALKCHFS